MAERVFYLMKVKGKAKIPDYIQLRDENFTLIGYFRPNRMGRLRKAINEPDIANALEKEILEMTAYNRIQKVVF